MSSGLAALAVVLGVAANAQGATAPGEVVVVARTPLADADFKAADVPAAIAGIAADDIARRGSLSLPDVLLQRVPSISIDSETGNDFEPDVQFRGFIATPVSGAPEGLAVYQNGVRINEAFGDNVRWDFIPTIAIRNLDIVTDNPAFGLNALGGGVDMRMQDGFAYRGLEAAVQGGSYGRVQGSAQAGVRFGDYGAYLAVEAAHDDGWRRSSPSTIRRLYGDLGWKGARTELRLNLTAADNLFGAAAAVPIQLLDQSYSGVFTTPQRDHNEMAMASLEGKVKVSDTLGIEGVAYVRGLSQHHLDGNSTAAQPCDADLTLLCFGDGGTPANGPDGLQLANPFGANDTPGEIDSNATRTLGWGGAVQATASRPLLGLDNNLVVGASLDAARTGFRASAQLGTIEPNFVVRGNGISLGASGDPISDGPVRLIAHNTYVGVYALDTLELTQRLSFTGGGRFNSAQVDLDDQLGGSLSGHNHYSRFNPVVGATFKVTPKLVAYAGYSQANRAPTPLELGCADPLQPCIIDGFLVSDPPLKQVVSHTTEAGLRGIMPAKGAGISWQLGLYRTDNDNDILNIPSPLNNGFGYFANVGVTRRQGLEALLSYKGHGWVAYASYAYVDATYRSALTLAAPGGNPAADQNGNVAVMPGDHISSVPKSRFKLGMDYDLTAKWTLGGDLQVVSSQFYGGDESNQNPPLPGYATVNVHASYQLTRALQLYGLIENLFDRRYDTFATFFDNASYAGNPAFPNLTDTRTATPGRPLAAYLGVRLRY